MAGRPALHGSESGQVRKEAATAILCKCRGSGSPPLISMNPRLLLTAACVLTAFASAPARAIDGMSFELGRGDEVTMGRLGVQWEFRRPLLQFGTWQLGSHIDLVAGYW